MTVTKCVACGARIGGAFGRSAGSENSNLCQLCDVAVAVEPEDRSIRPEIDLLPVTTGPTTAAGEIEIELDVISAECVFGMNIFRDMFAGIRDVVGGRSEASQKVLRDTRKTCLRELRKEAIALGADAVIGVDLDYGEFSGGGKSMLMLVATGTAVKLKK